MPLNSAMDKMMTELHLQGISIEQIADYLRKAPLDPHIISATKSAYALGCELRTVSDANTFFIETILGHHGLTGYFSEINTNPGFVDEEGRIRVFPYHDFHTSSHGCPDCPPNLCKSVIVKKIQMETSGATKRIIYLGDGKGDYCPTLNLTKIDYVMPRRDYPNWELICDNPMLVMANIHKWSDWEEQERMLLAIINQLVSIEATV